MSSVIEIRPTRNAGPKAVWEDRFDVECSMQEDKSPTGQYLWIGPDGRRMCLDQAMAGELWPLLKRFAETGTLADPTAEPYLSQRIEEERAACGYSAPSDLAAQAEALRTERIPSSDLAGQTFGPADDELKEVIREAMADADALNS